MEKLIEERRFICALCESLIQRMATSFWVVKLCNNCPLCMEAQHKQCPKCGSIKPLGEFTKETRRKNGLHPYCKQCNISRRIQHKINNPVQTITCQMLSNARRRAQQKNLAFNLDLDYVRSLVCLQCSLLPEISLDWSVCRGVKAKPLPNSPSLDRIDPTKGYVKGNVWIISHRANTIKSDASHEELKLVAEAVGRAIVNSLEW